jgi:hypothetical protein
MLPVPTAMQTLLKNVRRLSGLTGHAKCPSRGISVRMVRAAVEEGLVDVDVFETKVWLTDAGRKALAALGSNGVG